MPFSKEEVITQVNAAPYWYHRIQLYKDFTTPGTFPHPFKQHVTYYNVPEDLNGLRVLDIGAWDGYWSFEALARGAKEVVAIDDFSDDVGHLDLADRHKWKNFELCRDVLGYTKDQCSCIEMDIYDISPERLGKFDVVFFFGVLYHLRYPLYAIDKLSSVCDGAIYCESAVCDRYSPYDTNEEGHTNKVVMEFYPDNQYGGNYTNWWTPTVTTMCQMFKSAGFENIKAGLHPTDPKGFNLAAERGFLQGYKPGTNLHQRPTCERKQGTEAGVRD